MSGFCSSRSSSVRTALAVCFAICHGVILPSGITLIVRLYRYMETPSPPVHAWSHLREMPLREHRFFASRRMGLSFISQLSLLVVIAWYPIFLWHHTCHRKKFVTNRWILFLTYAAVLFPLFIWAERWWLLFFDAQMQLAVSRQKRRQLWAEAHLDSTQIIDDTTSANIRRDSAFRKAAEAVLLNNNHSDHPHPHMHQKPMTRLSTNNGFEAAGSVSPNSDIKGDSSHPTTATSDGLLDKVDPLVSSPDQLVPVPSDTNIDDVSGDTSSMIKPGSMLTVPDSPANNTHPSDSNSLSTVPRSSSGNQLNPPQSKLMMTREETIELIRHQTSLALTLQKHDVYQSSSATGMISGVSNRLSRPSSLLGNNSDKTSSSNATAMKKQIKSDGNDMKQNNQNSNQDSDDAGGSDSSSKKKKSRKGTLADEEATFWEEYRNVLGTLPSASKIVAVSYVIVVIVIAALLFGIQENRTFAFIASVVVASLLVLLVMSLECLQSGYRDSLFIQDELWRMALMAAITIGFSGVTWFLVVIIFINGKYDNGSDVRFTVDLCYLSYVVFGVFSSLVISTQYIMHKHQTYELMLLKSAEEFSMLGNDHHNAEMSQSRRRNHTNSSVNAASALSSNPEVSINRELFEFLEHDIGFYLFLDFLILEFSSETLLFLCEVVTLKNNFSHHLPTTIQVVQPSTTVVVMPPPVISGRTQLSSVDGNGMMMKSLMKRPAGGSGSASSTTIATDTATDTSRLGGMLKMVSHQQTSGKHHSSTHDDSDDDEDDAFEPVTPSTTATATATATPFAFGGVAGMFAGSSAVITTGPVSADTLLDGSITPAPKRTSHTAGSQQQRQSLFAKVSGKSTSIVSAGFGGGGGSAAPAQGFAANHSNVVSVESYGFGSAIMKPALSESLYSDEPLSEAQSHRDLHHLHMHHHEKDEDDKKGTKGGTVKVPDTVKEETLLSSIADDGWSTLSPRGGKYGSTLDDDGLEDEEIGRMASSFLPAADPEEIDLAIMEKQMMSGTERYRDTLKTIKKFEENGADIEDIDMDAGKNGKQTLSDIMSADYAGNGTASPVFGGMDSSVTAALALVKKAHEKRNQQQNAGGGGAGSKAYLPNLPRNLTKTDTMMEQDLEMAIRMICRRFIRENAIMVINIGSQTRQDILNKVYGPKGRKKRAMESNDITADIFDDAALECLRLLRDPFSRFRSQESYKRFKREQIRRSKSVASRIMVNLG